MLHLTPNQPSACPESGTLGTVVRQDVRHNKRPAHTDWRNTDGWDLGGFPLGLRHMSGAEGPLGTPVQHCHSSLIESLIGQGNHMTNQEKILHSYYTTAVKIFCWGSVLPMNYLLRAILACFRGVPPQLLDLPLITGLLLDIHSTWGCLIL